MGTARALIARWRLPLTWTALFAAGGSYYHSTGIHSIKNNSDRDCGTWEKQDDSKDTPLPLNQPCKSSRISQAPPDTSGRTLLQPLVSDRLAKPPKELPIELPTSQSAWDTFTSKISVAKDSFVSPNWPELIKQYVAPAWTALLPATIQTLQRELTMSEGSLADEIWSEAQDAELNPEITREARVRIGEGLCREERYFQWRRRQAMVKSLAAYLGLKEKDVHPDDIPTIAMCSSGGGLRALVAGTGSFLAAKEAGLWDCTMYTAGVSGSCWLQTIYNSSLGGQDFGKVVQHLKKRLGIHIAFPPEVLRQLTTVPTNKYLLRGLVEKLKASPESEFGLVDIYGLLLTSRLLVPTRNPLDLHDRDLKLSNQRVFIDNGANPLPIYTAVRHEIPPEDTTVPGLSMNLISDEPKPETKQETWFEWFEFTPYELFCEGFSAGIPMWATGRQFWKGLDVPTSKDFAVPELRISVFMGIWGSAFCATLAHYYKEVRPILRGLAGFGGIDAVLEGKSDDLIRVHPFDPASIPNFALGLKDRLPKTCPESIFTDKELRLMDAGMSNNLPIYPLLRPGRNVDMIVVFDASADIKEENWLSVVEGYARQRGVKGWPIGSGWPKPGTTAIETAKGIEDASSSSVKESDESLLVAKEQSREPSTKSKGTHVGSRGTTLSQDTTGSSPNPEMTDLGYCNVWLGTTQEQTSTTEPPPSKRLFHLPLQDDSDSDFSLMHPDAGIAVVYFPLLKNPAAPAVKQAAPSTAPISSSENANTSLEQSGSVEPIDPASNDFMSTWNFVYTPEQVDGVIGLAKANFAEGEYQVKRVVRGIYERKKRARLQRIREGELEGVRLT
ncbi:phospholipase A2 [Blastomyces dermatitidis ER-3]|uniref:Lysophospholipase n=1 Tax=Ajellomyces dermatitidis (strain ER-3 / ATCC MYA-2586) TaxID=559297 RepID=A0ABP2EXX6_AJEDR|nr:phospholipase A2 [Blastomyces dermatitidis ER-3]EEQ87449.1 phospholipase A2 [Blastomyces dermatitidis ER-3]EQL38262.1 phospholipase A2 [Blastomyces dermatitidis ATCC 26199]